MESWNSKTSEHIETPKNIQDFFDAIDIICKEHKLSISHEDGHGAFEIEEYDEFNIKWLKNANLNL